MAKIVEIGKTQIEVRLTHSKRNLIYFVENILRMKLLPYQEKMIKEIEKWNK